VRIFAASRLQSGDKEAAEERHAEHYRSVLSASDELYQLGGENVLQGLAFFDREWANIRAGQSWAEKNLQDSQLLPHSATPTPAWVHMYWIYACIQMRKFAGMRPLLLL